MADLECLVHDLLARVDALEQRNDVLERECAMLKQQNTTLVAQTDHRPRRTDVTDPIDADPVSPLESLSRRWFLRRAAQATAATVVAGALTHTGTQDAKAHHSTEQLFVLRLVAHSVYSNSETGSNGITGETNSELEDYAGVAGYNFGVGPGLRGDSPNGTGVIGLGLIGVKGTSSAAGYGASYGLHTNDGYGVVGDGHGSTRAGVLGRNGIGYGMRGEGKTGVSGVSPNSVGVFGEGGTGYGGVFKGTRAQVRLTPTGRTGKPTSGAHQIGELYLDKTGALFICTAAGTPGTWRKVSTTTA